MTLLERLVRLADLWAASNDRSVSRLATIVANDGKLFDRISTGGSCTVATYERFLDFFAVPSNWTQGAPDEAVELMQSVRAGIMADHEAASSRPDDASQGGKSDDRSTCPQSEAA